jgi:hypothetical protein
MLICLVRFRLGCILNSATGAKFTRCDCRWFGQPLPLIPSTAKPELQWRLKLKTFMTLSEAQLFVRRWERVLLPWLHLPDAFAAQAIERSFLGVALAPFPAFVAVTASGFLPLSRWPVSVIIMGITIMLLSYWLCLRFRAAGRLFEEADAQHLAGLRT